MWKLGVERWRPSESLTDCGGARGTRSGHPDPARTVRVAGGPQRPVARRLDLRSRASEDRGALHGTPKIPRDKTCARACTTHQR